MLRSRRVPCACALAALGRRARETLEGIPAEGRRIRSAGAAHFARTAGEVLPSGARLGARNACAQRATHRDGDKRHISRRPQPRVLQEQQARRGARTQTPSRPRISLQAPIALDLPPSTSADTAAAATMSTQRSMVSCLSVRATQVTNHLVNTNAFVAKALRPLKRRRKGGASNEGVANAGGNQRPARLRHGHADAGLAPAPPALSVSGPRAPLHLHSLLSLTAPRLPCRRARALAWRADTGVHRVPALHVRRQRDGLHRGQWVDRH